ncbi:DEAD/DEAH box helicase [Flavobacterium sp. CF136]|uniref:DEAD/DEAH box helicase n=1 Tax=Flavobacterium sp. (strain CF136) TaxID=1144313 RepID=UPI000271963A|nr:DEAD/DEAH box helicase [Flavobacterium sp. CF136]EJL66272.1 DNA/RNA helicase, superfamily II [Flavobacterium sp. CF136]
MAFQLRPYQSESIDLSVNFLKGTSKGNSLVILPTGSGKSVVIAKILEPLEGKTIVLQPSKEILEQNFEKFSNYGKASIYSASAGEKRIDKVTFCTIGSIINKKHLFKGLKNILIDECHLVNSDAGMYNDFIKAFPESKVLGLTATPYRLEQTSTGPQLTFITRSKPAIFDNVLYYVQNDVLFNAGFLAPLEYYNFDVIDRSKLELNSSGTDFTQTSLRRYYKSIDMPSRIVKTALTILSKRKNILIFCSLIEEAKAVQKRIPGSAILTGETKKEERERILGQFKNGTIKCLINVGVLTTGFDYPALEAVLMARSTMSLSLYYQIVGRVMRIFTYPDGTKKTGWFVDMGGNINFFGKIETMQIKVDSKGRFAIWNNGRQLTNVPFNK